MAYSLDVELVAWPDVEPVADPEPYLSLAGGELASEGEELLAAVV